MVQLVGGIVYVWVASVVFHVGYLEKYFVMNLLFLLAPMLDPKLDLEKRFTIMMICLWSYLKQEMLSYSIYGKCVFIDDKANNRQWIQTESKNKRVWIYWDYSLAMEEIGSPIYWPSFFSL